MRSLKLATARNIMIFMVDSASRPNGKAGLTLTITLSKDGGAFNSITPTVTERGNGWYNLALTTTHTDTLGDLTFHITGTGADPYDEVLAVTPDLPGVLADAVTHGGTTAKFRLGSTDSTPALYVTNTGNDAVRFEATTGGNGFKVKSATGPGFNIEGNQPLFISGNGNGSAITVAAGPTGHTIEAYNLGNGDVLRLSAAGTGTALRIQNYGTGKSLWVLDENNLTDTVDLNLNTTNLAAIADKLLLRNLAGGSDGGRTVQDALRLLRNRWTRSGSTLTVYAENDSTTAWSSIITTASLNSISESDPP